MRNMTFIETETPNPSKRKRVNLNAPRAEDKLSFFRRATSEEREDGAMPLVFWNVIPTGDYMQDVRRGSAIAEEMMTFLVEAPTNFNLTMLTSMLIDMQRFGDLSHRGLFVGFGNALAKFAVIGAKIIGPDAIRKDDEKLEREVGLDRD